MNCTCSPYDNLRPFKRSNIDSISEVYFGVYGFWYKKRCLYIGKAEKQPIKKRLMQHWNGCHNDKLQMWIFAKSSELRITFKNIKDINKIHKYERFYIEKYQPITNKTK